jgi:exopolyphosphatase/guanosine-5'-triphosphate,3'-diphosphate pyrophosphatase
MGHGPGGDPGKPQAIVAVIDLGSNSGRVVVYRYQAGGHLQLLAGSRASLRLVRELDERRRLSQPAMDRAWEAILDFRAIAQGAGAERILAVATAATRDAENGPGFIERIRGRLGIEVRILSGDEEARYGFLGAVRGLPVVRGVLFDLGGGSMQVSRFRQRRLTRSVSLPLGSLRLSDAFLKADPPSAREVRRLREHARAALEMAGVGALGKGEQLVGTGGTVRNLAKIDRRGREDYPITRLHGYELSRRRVKTITGLLAERKQKKREQVPGLNDDRGDSIVGGSLAIQTLMEVLEAPEVVVSGQGVREGLAVSLVTEELPEPAAVRQSSIAALVSRFDGWVPEQAERRRALVASLHEALEPAADPEVREALGQAATVLDIGRSIDFFDRHQHVADIVLATDLNGFSHRGIALVSAILRNAGDEDTGARSYAPLLVSEDGPNVQRAGVLLALADDIEERCPRGAAITLECRVRKDEAMVTVPQLGGWRERKIGPRFERAFDRKLVVTTGR